jgi:hypothetical protein
MVTIDSLRACGYCGIVYTISATEYSNKCPYCKSRSYNRIEVFNSELQKMEDNTKH